MLEGAEDRMPPPQLSASCASLEVVQQSVAQYLEQHPDTPVETVVERVVMTLATQIPDHMHAMLDMTANIACLIHETQQEWSQGGTGHDTTTNTNTACNRAVPDGQSPDMRTAHIVTASVALGRSASAEASSLSSEAAAHVAAAHVAAATVATPIFFGSCRIG